MRMSEYAEREVIATGADVAICRGAVTLEAGKIGYYVMKAKA